MSFRSKRELLAQVAPRYQQATHTHKSIILDEFVAATQYARKYAILLLSRPPLPTPAHICGDRPDGAFLSTLVLTDVATGWVESQALLYRSQDQLLQGLKRARQLVPFPFLGLDTDNGGEFINRELVAYCEQEQISFTRGRPYEKNDQCLVEQKMAR